MRKIPVLYRYIAWELTIPFVSVLFVFSCLLFLARSLKLVNLIVKKTASALDVVSLFSLIIPQFLELAFPMACLLAIIIGFGRLSADSELVVMRSSGFSLKKLLLPVSIFITLVTILSLITSYYIRPWSNYQLNLGLFRLATRQASSGLIAGTFNKVGPLTIYAKDILNNGELLKDVLIGDQRNPESQKLFFAQNAKFESFEQDRTITIDLFDGSMQEGTGTNLSHTNYSLNSITLSEEELNDSDSLQRKKTSEMSSREILTDISNTKTKISDKNQDSDKFHLSRLRVEYQKRLVLPFSCFAVGLLALSLGIQPSRGASKWAMTLSFVLGILLIITYYMAFALVSALAESTGAYIEILMWIPNVLFILSGVAIYRKVSSEKWTSVIGELESLMSKSFNSLTKRK